MTADELTNALREQETLNKLGGINKDALQERYNLLKASNDQQGLAILKQEILSKQNGDMLLKNISQMSLQQRFEASVEKVKELFVSIASGPIMGMLNGIAKLLENTFDLGWLSDRGHLVDWFYSIMVNRCIYTIENRCL